MACFQKKCGTDASSKPRNDPSQHWLYPRFREAVETHACVDTVVSDRQGASTKVNGRTISEI
ncbi:hypothetical protein HYE67_002600 [Fusarium culmorum]|uniref:Uncharacterized protein n=1 Tax=Fusarium culmorum TaxID=5516 RepID=A0A2T4GS93_FUSCU|nr:hypothetical protein FCULG_00006843 [Fusarium culmorum]QPC60369.1 hypothetical protein HYE67_002600 [Fusarium culmorum]